MKKENSLLRKRIKEKLIKNRGYVLLGYTVLTLLCELFFFLTNHPKLYLYTTIFSALAIAAIFIIVDWHKLNSKSLLSQPLFILSLLFPLHLFFAYGVWSWEGHGLNLSSDGFENFIKITKLPLLLLASAAPMAAIVNNIHRTIQTETQIEKAQSQLDLATEKNKLDLYYSHLKNYSDIFKTLPSFNLSRTPLDDKDSKHIEISINHPFNLYKKIFPKSTVFDGYNSLPDSVQQKKLINIYSNLERKISSTNHSPLTIKEQMDKLINIESRIILLCRELGISYQRESHLFMIQDPQTNNTIETSFSDEREVKEMLRGLRNILIDLFTLLDLPAVLFMGGSHLGDKLPLYVTNPNYRIFTDILPAMQRIR
ncbi:hypothetical protein QTV01_003938 [Enterobacter ludwigii]|jgi:hypothetical protein|nr:hypothetical protein [Enterobacter ludwigii]